MISIRPKMIMLMLAKELKFTNMKLTRQKERYPDSNTRLKYLDEHSDDTNRHHVRDGMYFILNKCDLYLFKIYEQRDVAIELIKQGRTEEALKVLSLIGQCPDDKDDEYMMSIKL